MPDDDPGDTAQSLTARQATVAHRARYPVEAAYTPPGPYATTTSTVTDGAGNAIYSWRGMMPEGRGDPRAPA